MPPQNSNFFTDPNQLIAQALTAAGGVAALHAVRSLRVVLQRQVRVASPVDPSVAQTNPPTAKFSSYPVEICRAQGGKIRIVEYLSPLQRQVTILQGLAGIRRWENVNNFDNSTLPPPLPLIPTLSANLLNTASLSPPEVATIKRRVRLYPRNFLAHAAEFQYQLIPLPTTIIASTSDHSATTPPDDNLPIADHQNPQPPAIDSANLPDPQELSALELPAEQVCYIFHSLTGQCCQLIDRLTNETIHYHDYRTIDGIATPHLEEIFYQGQLQQRDLIRSVNYNLDLAPELFVTT
jgi:hypothetical protein